MTQSAIEIHEAFKRHQDAKDTYAATKAELTEVAPSVLAAEYTKFIIANYWKRIERIKNDQPKTK